MVGGSLYTTAASIIQEAKLKRRSVKSLCFSCKFRNKRILFALVLETLKRKKLLEKVASQCNDVWKSFKEELDESLEIVLLYETLFGQGLPKNNEYHQLFVDHAKTLSDTLQNVYEEYPELKSKKECFVIPRYVRVNSLKTTLEKVVKTFENEGYQLTTDKKPEELDKKEFSIDQDIANLLIFYPSVDFHDHSFYRKGHIILQDKASCLPAFILNPPTGSIIIDACAAPGNKSSHLAALINNKGSIYAFDLDQSRLKLMKELLATSGSSCITARHHDFLKIRHDHPTYSKTEYILLDPSCSGSGIVSRMDDLVDDDEGNGADQEEHQTKRLKGLCGFQTAVLSHALTFPRVKRVVYSTCSVHKEENESVVKKALDRFCSKYKLVNILPTWKNRGIGDWEEASKCIRAVTETDRTNGFFVAMFERIEDMENISIERESETNVSNNNTTNERNTVIDKPTVKKRKTTVTEQPQQPLDFSTKVKRKKRNRGVKKPVTS